MKELKKMNTNELKTLSRKEMKMIMAGSGKGCDDGCTQNSDCTGNRNCPSCQTVNYGSAKFCTNA